MPVTALDAILPVLADGDGRAVRTANFRHRHLVAKPAVVLPFQIGGESFALAAVAWGFSPSDLNVLVVPDPRERELFYRRMTVFAAWFDRLFQDHGEEREERTTRRHVTISTTRSAPQLVVPNSASAQLLARVGRRLAYLDRSPLPVDPVLIAAGRHLLFLRDHLRMSGQQLIVALTDLLASHWATPQTPAERLLLPSLAAWIDPPEGMHGFEAAQAAEVGFVVGPVPSGDDDATLFPLVASYRQAAKDGNDRARAHAERAIAQHWQGLLVPAWDLCWKLISLERTWREAPSTDRRWAEDRAAFTRHIDWHRSVGHRRVRPTSRQAAIAQYRLESAASLLEAEEAIDDPLRMIAYVLRDEAIMGEVVRVDPVHRETTSNGQVRTYPLITIASNEPCVMPLGKELWWSGDPGGSGWTVRQITPPALVDGRWHITLRRVKSSTSRSRLPAVESPTAFSILNTNAIPPNFPAESDIPWTHRLAVVGAPDGANAPLDGVEAEGEALLRDTSLTDADLEQLRNAWDLD